MCARANLWAKVGDDNGWFRQMPWRSRRAGSARETLVLNHVFQSMLSFARVRQELGHCNDLGTLPTTSLDGVRPTLDVRKNMQACPPRLQAVVYNA